MFADDRPEYPMCFFLRARLALASASLDRTALSAALRSALARHPMLSTRLSGERWTPSAEIAWTAAAEEPSLYVDFGEGDEPFRYPVSGGHGDGWLDPTRDFPIRFFVREKVGGNGVDLWAQCHHAAVDATGGARLIEDALALYAGVEPRPIDPTLLETRHELRAATTEGRAAFWRDLHRIWIYFTHFARPLPPRRGEMRPREAPSGSYPARLSRVLGQETQDALRIAAHRFGATVNDLLLRDLFLAVDEYAAKQGVRKRVRLAMPINMRTAADAKMSAANVVSMCFLDREPSSMDQPQELLASIARETTSIKRYRLGTALLRVVGALARFPGGLRLIARAPGPWSCSSTAVLSNLGRPFDLAPLPRDGAGRLVARDLTLSGFELYPPIRSQTRGAFGVVQYAGALFFGFNYDARWLSESAARELMVAWTSALELSATAAVGMRRPLGELVEASRSRRAGSAPFRSLPIGKNVGRRDPVR